MTNTILISRRLIEAIKHFQWKGCGVKGFLIGPDGERSTVLAAWQNDIADVTNIGTSLDDCLTYFPCGKSVIGLALIAPQNISTNLQSGDNDGLEQELVRLFGSVDALLEQFGRESVLVMCLYKSGNEDSSAQEWEASFVSVTKSGMDAKHVDVTGGHDTDFGVGIRMRLKADIPLMLSSSSKDAKQWSSQIDENCSKLEKSIQAGSFAFGFDCNRALIHKGGVSLGSDFKSWKLVKDIRKYLKDTAEQREEKAPGPATKGIQRPIDVSLLQLGADTHNRPSHAPIIAHRKGDFSTVQLKLPIDVLVEVRESLAVQKLYTMLVKSVSRQISASFKCLESYRQADQLYTPEVFHFKPSCLDSTVSIIYPRGIAEEKLENTRLAYHDQLLMAKDRPCLRKASAGIFLNPTAPGGYLVNPHIGLNIPQSVKNGTVCTVAGYYSYHHYMQDRFNDDKWGCAYRSLQTIVSWFKYQGYTDKNVPSHREIQQALHDCGDKGEKFVGSRQWIGSFEVSFVLDHLLGVSSKFINVNSGAELSTTGQQLLSHFQTQGTPVMIGGGVLAHTILGVAYDEMTGDIGFLILDPHYTAGEDLKVVQDKGWCGWKDMKFWDQTAHYNMCLPQRPMAV